jgi:hypothetical protein
VQEVRRVEEVPEEQRVASLPTAPREEARPKARPPTRHDFAVEHSFCVESSARHPGMATLHPFCEFIKCSVGSPAAVVDADENRNPQRRDRRREGKIGHAERPEPSIH